MSAYDPKICGRRIPPTKDGIPCQRKGVYVIKIKAWADLKKSHKPLEMFIGLSSCQECSVDLVPADFVTDEGWDMIEQSVSNLGKALPFRSTLELDLVPFTEVPDQWKGLFGVQP